MSGRPLALLCVLSLVGLGCGELPPPRVSPRPMEPLACPGPEQAVPDTEAVPAAVPPPRIKLSSDAAAAVAGNNQFALDLYARLRPGDGNLFLSPASISTALAMTFAGARGQTADEMAKALHFDLPPARLHPAFEELLGDLRAERPGYRLAVANRLWGQRGHSFQPEFLQATRTHYGAELAELDIAQQTEAARLTINQWVAAQTREKIQDLIPANQLDPLTRLVLTNAIWFKGDWASPFDKLATRTAPFRVSAERTVDVPLMNQVGHFRHAAVQGVEVLELPYVGEQLAMLVLLPEKADGLADLEKRLTPANLKEWSEALRPTRVDVTLPRFRLTVATALRQPLEALGMVAAFAPGKADFSGLSTSEGLFIGAVFHKAFVDVHEQGTEAAAATAVMALGGFGPPVFRADRPFVFLIRDNATGSMLFLGRVVDPTGA